MSNNGDGKDRWDIDSMLLDPTAGQRDMPATFPGYQGAPFRGQIPDLKSDDPQHKQPRVAARAHVEVLNMAEPDDLKRYEEIAQLAANGAAVISFEERQYDKSIQNWRVFVRWGDLFAYNPEKGHDSGRID